MSNSLQPHGLHSPWNSPGQNTGVGSLSVLQGIFLTQGWNPGLSHCRWILYQLIHKGSPWSTRVGSLSLFQWIFPTQESKLGSPALQVNSLPTELWGKHLGPAYLSDFIISLEYPTLCISSCFQIVPSPLSSLHSYLLGKVLLILQNPV